ncbi:protein CUSTOS-like isoform X1 [Haliotis rufescens]|uniref:protein CUSTOS-like isoform X1 n=2 Tax=Haliotis rufescens TaxID=6454 RepID=UPI00201EC2F3|nr:protein CUSTOS-like isoform X1 [Haliotis rufescens]
MATATVGRVSDVSSSESSDEDETSRFREAAVLDCHHSTSASYGKTSKSIQNSGRMPRPQPNDVSTRPSLRPSRQEGQELKNELNTTPEFRAFVGKKLSQIVDSMIEVDETKTTPSSSTATDMGAPDTGVRLFASCTRPVSLEDRPPVRKCVPKRPVESSSSDSSEDERLASAAVSHEFIFKDTTLSDSFKKYKADPTNANLDVVKLKKSKKKKKKKVEDLAEISVQSTEPDAGVDADNDNEHTKTNGNKKCKKKKKKKKCG